MEHCDLLVVNIAELVTAPVSTQARHGLAMSELVQIKDAALAVEGERIAAVGPRRQLEKQFQPVEIVDVKARAVVPGFVDPHTHAAWAGIRAGEFEQRIAGASYMEIMAAGGGILSTVQATRAADLSQLMAETGARLERMLTYGTTTAEIKTGYGLDLANERKMLDAIHMLDAQYDLDLVPTFLGAHAVPSEYKGNPDAYVDSVVEEMLPDLGTMIYTVNTETAGSYRQGAAQFCDVFCERGVFDVEQTRRILEAAKGHGLALKLHVDEFEPMGGTSLAVELGATSVDHLVRTGDKELQLLAGSATIAVVLPGTPFGLGQSHYAPARKLIDYGGAVALATDLNPGTSWCESMPMMMALATRMMRMTPAEALTAATLNAAYAIGFGRSIGALAPGYQADFVILESADYRDLTYRYGTNPVAAVYKKGRRVRNLCGSY
ncbi:MAG: imidazolonepropionase [Chloroflexi bacterium]|nr:imidazolonepropionase [Chloroflexota bacterium]